MNIRAVAIFVLCVVSAVSSFAQGWAKLSKLPKLNTQVTRGIQVAKPQQWVRKLSLPSVVNGYLRTPDVIHFKVAGVSMRAVHFSRGIWVQKEDLYIPKGSLAVVGPEKEITVYKPGDQLPLEIEAGLDAAFEEKYPRFFAFEASIVVDPSESSSLPWQGKASYEAQVDIGLDVDVYYQGQADEILVDRITQYKTKVYRVPSANIYYQPPGRAGRYLTPESDLILVPFAKEDGTPIKDGQIVFDGLTDETWRMFFEPIQQ